MTPSAMGDQDEPDLQPGDFTRAIDAERLLGAKGASAQERELERLRVEAEQRERAATKKQDAQQQLMTELRGQIIELLAGRQERIQRISDKAVLDVRPADGEVIYRIPPGDRPHARIVFFCQVNESGQAFDIGSRVTIEGKIENRKDSLAPINIKKVADRLKQIEHFRDNKLLDFVREFLDTSG